MECIHRPINVRHSIIKIANLGLKHNATPTSSMHTPTTAGSSDNSSVAMDTVTEGTSSEMVTKETSDDITNTVTASKESTTGRQGNSTIRTQTMDNPELSYAGSVTITTGQPATNITGHTGYLTFATLGPSSDMM